MFTQNSIQPSTSKEKKEKGQKSPDELWVAKIVKSKKSGTSGKRKLRCLSPGALQNLRMARAAVFVSVDSRDFEPDKIDVILAALCKAGIFVDLIIVDSNAGFNKVTFDCSKLEDQELQQRVFPLGELRAKEWVQQNKSTIDQYQNKYLGRVNIRYCSCKDTGDGIKSKIEDEPRFKDAKGIIDSKLQDQDEGLKSKLQLTIEEHFHNKEASESERHNSEMYLKSELPIYYTLATNYKYIIYTSEESAILKYTRELVAKQDRAKYLQIDFTTIRQSRLSADYIAEKINHGGGIQGDIGSMEDLVFLNSKRQTNPPIRKSESAPDLSLVSKLVPQEQPKPRSASLNDCECAFFSAKRSSSPPPPTIADANEAFFTEKYNEAFDILMKIDYGELNSEQRNYFDTLLENTKAAINLVLKSQVKAAQIQYHNGNGKTTTDPTLTLCTSQL